MKSNSERRLPREPDGGDEQQRRGEGGVFGRAGAEVDRSGDTDHCEDGEDGKRPEHPRDCVREGAGGCALRRIRRVLLVLCAHCDLWVRVLFHPS